jgi:hypothetical protein
LRGPPSGALAACGHIALTRDQLNDYKRLLREAVDYAVSFISEENSRSFNLSCSNFRTNRAFVFAIEAARLLASGDEGDRFAVELLRLAVREIQRQPSEWG